MTATTNYTNVCQRCHEPETADPKSKLALVDNWHAVERLCRDCRHVRYRERRAPAKSLVAAERQPLGSKIAS